MANLLINQNLKEKAHASDHSDIVVMKPKTPLRLQFALTAIASILATLVFFLIRLISKIDISKIFLPLLAFPLNTFIVFYLFPTKLEFPLGKVKPREFVHRIGLITPPSFLRQAFLGCILGCLSLTGMLIGSLLSGKYVFNVSTLTVEQVVFATVPGVWEEIFFRGIFMFIFLRIFKNIRKAVIVQSIIFGVFHFSKFKLWNIVDIFSIMIMGLVFTYIAHRTNSLIPGIIFHFLHDAFLYLVQLPEGVYSGTVDNLAFYLSLWAMLALGALITTFVTRNKAWKCPIPLYSFVKLER